MLYEYIPIHLGLAIASLLSFIFLSLSYILSTAKFQMTFEKLSTYECGILFVIFDLEIVFLFPWCVTIPFMNFFGFKIFMFFYELRKGALDFASNH
uniref:NADH-ubiquinone oxidoreductase chain 3 n=1 Tax=Parastrongyloides trichosuri TaxID=131310 RepID=A0A0N5A7J1_PARTI